MDKMFPSRSRIVAGAAVAAGLLAAAGGASAQRMGELVTISTGSPFGLCTADHASGQPGTNFPGSAIEPWVAVNPLRPGHLLTGVQQDRWSDGGSRGLRAGISIDGGKHWRAQFPKGVSDCTRGRFQRSTDPWVAFGRDGTAYFFSLAFDNNPDANTNGESAMLVSRSGDGGRSWEWPFTLIDDTDPLAFNDKNSMTADPLVPGNAYAVWDRLYGPADAFRAPGGSDEHGAAAPMAPPLHDGTQMTRNRLATMRATAAGQEAPAAAEVFGPTYFSRTTNSGKFWSYAVPIYDPGSNAQTIGNVIVVNKAGDLLDFFTHILFNPAVPLLTVDFIRSRDHGLSWTKAPVTVTPFNGVGAVTPDSHQPIRDANIIPSVGADRHSGSLYVLWEDTQFGAGNQLSILFSQSIDDGTSWSSPAVISKTPASKVNPLRGQAFNGTLGVAENGTLVATYYDFRNDTNVGKEELADAWVVFCTPGKTAKGDCSNGDNWGREARLTPASFDITLAPLTGSGLFLGDYFSIAAHGKSVSPVFTAVTGKGQTSLFTRLITLP